MKYGGLNELCGFLHNYYTKLVKLVYPVRFWALMLH